MPSEHRGEREVKKRAIVAFDDRGDYVALTLRSESAAYLSTEVAYTTQSRSSIGYRRRLQTSGGRKPEHRGRVHDSQ